MKGLNRQRAGFIFIGAIWLHGPIDIAVTIANWSMESNPLVLMIGLELWITFKIILIILLIPLWFKFEQNKWTWYLMTALFIFGVLTVTPNLIYL